MLVWISEEHLQLLWYNFAIPAMNEIRSIFFQKKVKRYKRGQELN